MSSLLLEEVGYWTCLLGRRASIAQLSACLPSVLIHLINICLTTLCIQLLRAPSILIYNTLYPPPRVNILPTSCIFWARVVLMRCRRPEGAVAWGGGVNWIIYEIKKAQNQLCWLKKKKNPAQSLQGFF